MFALKHPTDGRWHLHDRESNWADWRRQNAIPACGNNQSKLKWQLVMVIRATKKNWQDADQSQPKDNFKRSLPFQCCTSRLLELRNRLHLAACLRSCQRSWLLLCDLSLWFLFGNETYKRAKLMYTINMGKFNIKTLTVLISTFDLLWWCALKSRIRTVAWAIIILSNTGTNVPQFYQYIQHLVRIKDMR